MADGEAGEGRGGCWGLTVVQVRDEEAEVLLELLPSYLAHLEENKGESLICKMLQLTRVHWHSVRDGKYECTSEWLVVMSHCFPTSLPLHRVYDVKGSREGRALTKEELNRPGYTLRDYEFFELCPLGIGEELKNKLLQVLESDARMLAKHGVMDYSLLVGVHNCSNEEGGNDQSKQQRSTAHQHLTTPFEIQDGGVRCGDSIFFFGLVDVLQGWNQRKHWEMCFKGLAFESTSSVPPEAYLARFIRIMNESFN